ncbi:hypothetical protein S7335_1715 [Synechococcus sp. PCC 7335]|uniref:hypothetical protein n=1 Tax=Synechococcus sp. (strain ATCC 29403 / PCC 7335) TaxID=91464 RepID=UPI00017ECA7B|nr:hypothetical protein [Synechococcus sp. PCC 7335]EDX84018.1 hypothetical protein S7335_1715 [Synechococcus sp. PCC 7335]
MQDKVHTILVPAGAEYRAVKRGLDKAQHAPQLVAIPAGPQGLETFLRDWSMPELGGKGLLLIGLGGSLVSKYRVGEAIALEKIWNHATGQIFECDAEITQWLAQRLTIEAGIGVACDRIITSATEKQQLRDTYSADVVDMEAAVLLKTLSAAVGIVRVISDDCKSDLPDIGNAITPDGSLRPVQLAIGFIQKPKAAIRLISGSLTALKALEELTRRAFLK